MHPIFQLNNEIFQTTEELIDFSYVVSEDLALFLEDWFDENDFVIVNTSGSTGKPKPIQIKKEFMRNSAKATGAYFNLGARTKALCCLSVQYIAGKMMVIRALELGWHLEVVDPVSNPLENAFDSYDFAAMVPMQVKASLWDLHMVKKLIIGGGALSEDLVKQLQHISTRCYATYGMTETVTHIAVKKLNNFNVSSSDSFKNNCQAELVEANYEVLPNISISQDKRDCLVIDAPLLSTEKVITNDIVKLHSETSFEWLGRYDNVINSGGVKLHPEQIEKELSKVVGTRFFVTGIPDTILGEKLILIVEGEEKEFDFSELNLSKYQIPKQTFFVAEFVETETKKIQRAKTLDLVNL